MISGRGPGRLERENNLKGCEKMEKRIYTVADVAEVLQISKPKAYELVRIQGFPKILVGRAIRVPIKEFEDWVTREATRGEHGQQ